MTGHSPDRPGTAGTPVMCRQSVPRWALACLAAGATLIAASVCGVVLLAVIR